MNPTLQLNEFIKVFDDVIPHDLCDRIVKEYETEHWAKTRIGDGTINLNVRNVDALSMSRDEIISLNQNTRKQLDNEVFDCAGKALIAYRSCFPDSLITADSGYELLRYNIGQFYSTHTDSMSNAPRTVSCSFSLNDDYEGGEFGFWDRQHIVKAKKGSVVMFPSNFMYPHQILPVTKGTRYSIITWFI